MTRLTIKEIGVILSFIAMVVTGTVWVEARYAKADDVEDQGKQTQLGFTDLRIDYIEDKLNDLAIKEEHGALTAYDRSRILLLQKQLGKYYTRQNNLLEVK